jgi:hypothetical protein
MSVNEKKIIARIKKKNGGRPFEYLFFLFLFVATIYSSVFTRSIEDVSELIRAFYHLLAVSFFYIGAIIFGYFHYIKGWYIDKKP